MSGPRVTTGKEMSLQSYATPACFIEPLKKRFGKIAFDLAAHAGNAKAERYFAPPTLTKTWRQAEPAWLAVDALESEGAERPDVEAWCAAVDWDFVPLEKGQKTIKIEVPNRDKGAVAFDSFTQDWSKLDGLLFLNPPFADIAPWARRCSEEAQKGARIAFLVPAAVGSNWFAQYVYQKAHVYALNGRIPFDPANPTWGYPKDCMLCLYDVTAAQGFDIWHWR